jgi:glycine betaine/proline transport system substrate-binding protein
VNFTDAVQGWFVPRYVVEGDTERGIDPIAPDLRAVDQLDQYATTFSGGRQSSTGAFYGGVPGWTAHKINCMKLKAYRLDDNYAQVTSESTADLFGALATAYDNGDPILLYLWAPTSPIARYDLVQLEEPPYNDSCWATTRGCAYPTGDVRILVHGDIPQRAPEITEFLENFSMDIEAVSEVLVRIEDENLTPDEAAMTWLAENEATWSAWVPPEVAARVSDALAEMGS